MRYLRACLIITSVFLLTISHISCKVKSNQSDTVSMKKDSETEQTYTDSFAYCKAVGNINSPDSRYVGPKVPEVIASVGYKRFLKYLKAHL